MHKHGPAVVLSATLIVSAVGRADDSFSWTVVPASSTLTTTLSATIGSVTLSDSETNEVAGTIGGTLGLPSYDFTTIHLTTADLAYTSDPTFNLSAGFLGGVNVTSTGLGFGIPGPNGLGFAATSPAPVNLVGEFTQNGNGAEGRGSFSYAGYGIIGGGIGPATQNLLDYSPFDVNFNGTVTQVGNQVRLSVPISLDESSVTDDGVTVRARVSGTIVATATTTANGWKADADGTWSDANFVAGGATSAPGATGGAFDTAVFGRVVTTQRTVNVGIVNVRLKRWIIDAGDVSRGYTFQGEIITLGTTPDAWVDFDVRSGKVHVGQPIALIDDARFTIGQTDATAVDCFVAAVQSFNRYDMEKLGVGVLKTDFMLLGDVNVRIGGVRLVGGPTVSSSSVMSLKIEPGAFFDVGAGAIGVSVGTNPVLSLTQTPVLVELKRAADAGWIDIGLTTSQADGRHALGYRLSNATTLSVRYTLLGDTDLNRVVDFSDLLLLAKGYNQPGLWFEGDFDYNGAVNFNDLLILARNYSQPFADTAALDADFAGEWQLARAMVPEPALASISALGLLGTRRRRRVG